MGAMLEREDIVGKRLSSVFTSEWIQHGGFASCDVLVELEDGTVFPLMGVEAGPAHPIQRIDSQTSRLIPADRWITDACRGRTVAEVIVSDYWPWLGLHLSGGKILIISTDC